jgi:glycerol-3-phosphate O-acyltransferase
MVLQRYVQMATEGGVPQAMYPEGGLTTDGRLREPKLGLLDYMLKTFDAGGERDLVFVPVGINYDRVLEDRTLLRKLDPETPRSPLLRTIGITARFAASQAGHALRGRRFRHGYACVNFGSPVSMRDWVRARGIDFRTLDDAGRRPEVAAVGRLLMGAIGRIVPALPVPLVATVFLREPQRAWSELELKASVQALMADVEAAGGHVYVPRADRDYAIGVGLRMLTLRHLVIEADGLYRVSPQEIAVLRYYANSVAHFFDAPEREPSPRQAVPA